MASVRTYQRRIVRLKSLIADAEWYQPTYNGTPSCPFCGNQQHWGHTPDCVFVTEFKRKPETECAQ
jgi:hypothetical protein